MSNSTHAQSDPEAHTQVIESLRRWFSRPIVRKVTRVVVPGALAAILWPIVGPAAGTAAVVVAVHNGLKALGITMSDDTITKVVEGADLGEDDYRSVLEQLVKSDPEVNKEAAKVLAATAPEMTNVLKEQGPTERKEWANRIQESMKAQGGTLGESAEEYGALLQKDGEAFAAALEALQQRLKISQQVIAEQGGRNEENEQRLEGVQGGAEVDQTVKATGEGSVNKGNKQEVKWR